MGACVLTHAACLPMYECNITDIGAMWSLQYITLNCFVLCFCRGYAVPAQFPFLKACSLCPPWMETCTLLARSQALSNGLWKKVRGKGVRICLCACFCVPFSGYSCEKHSVFVSGHREGQRGPTAVFEPQWTHFEFCYFHHYFMPWKVQYNRK